MRIGIHAASRAVAAIALVSTLGACASNGGVNTQGHEKTVRNAGIGAAAGALGSVLLGNHQADEILAGAAIGAVVGGGVGAYLDRQQSKLAQIPGTTVERVGSDTMLVHFQNDIAFPRGSSSLDSQARSTLDQVSAVLLDYPKTAVVVRGHADDANRATTDQELAQRRADAVRGYLVGRGVAAERVAAVAYTTEAQSDDGTYGNEGATAYAGNGQTVDVLLKAKAG